MATITKRPLKKKTTATKLPPIPARYAKILRQIPGYDSISTAEDCIFVPEKADQIIEFFTECLVFIEGEKGGKPFHLETWQKAILANLYGWIRPNGTRRYREAFIYVPRKNGKTPLVAGLVLYGLFCEEEPGNQIYSAAANRDQASLIYRHAKAMLLAEEELKHRGEIYESSRTIVKKGTFSKYQALASDSKSQHGLNASMILVDELHAQPNSHLVDTLITSIASRTQPMIIYITTADFDRPSICNEKLDYAKKVQQGIARDHAFLPVIYETSREANWKDPKVWAKANPNLDISVSREYMERECKRAISTPSYQNTFKRLHLNMQTTQDVRWLDMGEWDACRVEELQEKLVGLVCYAGLDLASTSDLCSLALWFPEVFAALFWYWLPEDNAQTRWDRARVPYPLWIQEGHIKTTPGNVTDYDFVREDILETFSQYDVQEIAVDKWNSTQLQTQLIREGITVIQYAQSPKVMSAPTKELERLVMNKKMQHTGDPVTRWCLSNVVLDSDHEGNVKPSKERSVEKIDGVISLVMAMGRAMITPEKKKSVYDRRGLISV